MTKPWRVTQQAEQSLLDIAPWTVETFGPRQADAYEQDILDKMDDIAGGRCAHSKLPFADRHQPSRRHSVHADRRALPDLHRAVCQLRALKPAAPAC